ncbi:TIM-barrel domain-containing protein [Flavobacterium sp.]|uniref:glycoside hydrolase family 31 protein n=1 Tax=Flavobacterium sp. TaxID=239 RepID=UPI0037537A22
MKKLLILLLITSISFAQNATRKYISHSWETNFLNVKVTDGNYQIKLISDNIAQTTFIPNGEIYNPISHAVVLETNVLDIQYTTNESNFLEISSKTLKIHIEFNPFKISYLKNDIEFLSEKNGYTKKDSTEVIDFNITADEVLYGGGARVLGMNRRGNRLQLYNRAQYGYGNRAELMNFCIPLVLSSKLYAVHFDNPAIGYLDLDSKKDNTIAYETISGRKTYQVIVGDSWEGLVKYYTDLTGKQPLPPRWAFGNLSSRFGYHNQDEVESTIKKFEENKIPVDAIILDLYWFGKTVQHTLGNLDWDKDNFPNPDKMIADLNFKNIKTILITEPFILTTSTKWNEAIDKKILATDKLGNPAKFDFYFGNSGIIDIWKPEGKTWFWNVYKKLINQGVAGLWGDLGEPEAMPSNVLTFGGKADEIHNIYGHNWAKLIADGYKNDFPNQRPFILMRAGYSGSQRFGMIPWSGDVSRSWDGLSGQMEVALQMGMQGIGYMHSDLGGFAGDYFDNELYLRWLQYGVFNPIFRPHAHEAVASEVAKKDIVTMAKAKKLVELRYQMLPYNYTLAYQNSQNGIPLMRPLFFDEPSNLKLQTSSEEYLWGKDLLVKPIIKAGIKETEMYFPNNSNWFDFYTGKKYIGGTTTTLKVNQDYIPTFVRGNVFYPLTKLVQNTTLYSNSDLDLHFYYEGKQSSEREFYFDDGKTPNAENNIDNHEILTCSTELIKNIFSINLESKTNNQELLSKGKNGIIYFYNFTKKPKSIKINDTLVTSKFDKKTKILQLNYSHTSYKTNIVITF